jgi:hypothetical protein
MGLGPEPGDGALRDQGQHRRVRFGLRSPTILRSIDYGPELS